MGDILGGGGMYKEEEGEWARKPFLFEFDKPTMVSSGYSGSQRTPTSQRTPRTEPNPGDPDVDEDDEE